MAIVTARIRFAVTLACGLQFVALKAPLYDTLRPHENIELARVGRQLLSQRETHLT
jgi:hypothetical protein